MEIVKFILDMLIGDGTEREKAELLQFLNNIPDTVLNGRLRPGTSVYETQDQELKSLFDSYL
jgi:hypothetical protein